MYKRQVYMFTEGNATMRNLLGGKGANLAEMTSLGLPVPQGFTITTEACTQYYEDGKKINDEIMGQIMDAIVKMEEVTGKKFGDKENPLLVSVRSGARASMPGTVSYTHLDVYKRQSLHSQLLIMDEPTSTLTEGETRKLFSVINNLKSKGISMIYISHRMEEIFEICDSYTVLRDGTFVHSGEIKEVDVNQIIEYMVGRSLASVYPEKKNKVGEVILEADHISNGKEVKDVSFSLRKGEILGFAGLVGAGRTETLKAVFGADSGAKGEIKINGKPVQIRSPRDAIKPVSYTHLKRAAGEYPLSL